MNLDSDSQLWAARELACAVIQQAIEDAQNKPRYKRNNHSKIRVEAQQDAIRFLQSELFAKFCGTLKLPVDRLRRAAYLANSGNDVPQVEPESFITEKTEVMEGNVEILDKETAEPENRLTELAE